MVEVRKFSLSIKNPEYGLFPQRTHLIDSLPSITFPSKFMEHSHNSLKALRVSERGLSLTRYGNMGQGPDTIHELFLGGLAATHSTSSLCDVEV